MQKICVEKPNIECLYQLVVSHLPEPIETRDPYFSARLNLITFATSRGLDEDVERLLLEAGENEGTAEALFNAGDLIRTAKIMQSEIDRYPGCCIRSLIRFEMIDMAISSIRKSDPHLLENNDPTHDWVWDLLPQQRYADAIRMLAALPVSKSTPLLLSSRIGWGLNTVAQAKTAGRIEDILPYVDDLINAPVNFGNEMLQLKSIPIDQAERFQPAFPK